MKNYGLNTLLQKKAIQAPDSLKRTERIAILISTLCHLVIVHFFIFTFEPLAIAHKPPFIFLGSILDKHDFAKLNSIRTNPPDKQLAATIEIQPQPTGLYTDKKTTITKPTFTPDIKMGTKNFLKFTFEEDVSKKQSDSNFAEDMGIDLTVPKRSPLRLYR